MKCKAPLSSVSPLLRFCLVSGCFLSLSICGVCRSYITDSAVGHEVMTLKTEAILFFVLFLLYINTFTI